MQDWLQIARNQAEERFRSLPFPSAKDENFRFTPVAYRGEEIAAGAAGFVPATLGEEEAALLSLHGEEAETLGQAPGVLFTDLLRAATLGSESLRGRLRDGDVFRDDKFAQLTSARWKNGAFVHVPAGVKVQKPLRFVTQANGGEEHYRHLIILEEGAEATVIEEQAGGEAAGFLGVLTEVRLGRGSRLNWVVFQNLGEGTESVMRQRLDLGEGAELRHTPLHLGGKLVQVRQETHLAGAGASFETQGAARGHQHQHFDFWLDVRHEAPATKSEMGYWFVMSQKARGVFNGLVDVKRNAPNCESSQRSKTLLMGSGSVHTIPKLIICTDEVKCSHGASVSSVSPEQLHYLQSRGIPRGEAERMIVRGFTEVVAERFPTEELRDRADAALDRKQGGAQ